MRKKNVSMIGNLTRDMMNDVMETALKKPIQTGEFRKNPVEPAWRCPAGFLYELIETENFIMEYLRPQSVVTGRVILQLHGGGYIGPMKNIYRRFAVKYSKLSYGADVLTIDYRVAPENPFPAAVEDAVYAYKWLLDEKNYKPDQIVVAGDSAGGGLALALCMYAKDHGLPLPGKLHDNPACRIGYGDKGVVFLSGNAGQRLKPVGIMGSPSLNCPVLHCMGHYVCNGRIQFRSVLDSLF